MAHSIQIQERENRSRSSVDNLLRSQRLALALNQVRRVTGAGNYWRWIDVPELADGIEISAIVSPLRYDVIVRKDFFSFYAAHRDLYAKDSPAFVEMTKQTSYFTWFTESEAVRTNAHLRGDAEALDRYFVQRIDRAVALYENVLKDGFSPQSPITLKTAKRLLPPTTDRGGPPTGKRTSAKYFMADGCHRLALFMAFECRVLPSRYFRVKSYQQFSPFDSTSLLARRLGIEPAQYFGFLSSHYTAPKIMTARDDFLEHIRKYKPELLDEVQSVIRVDGFGDE